MPKVPQAVLEITDIEDRPAWDQKINYNRFRGVLEIQKSDRGDQVWLINELDINDYLKGVKETSDISPLEYQKAIAVAARTYALYHWQKKNKHAGDNFDVDATYDQVYKGYAAEQALPKFTRAVIETNGQIVTAEGKLAITPYFSQSDGRTRSWNEIWNGGEVKWLQSVEVPWDRGLNLLGHGVGMSARAAINMANEGMTYDQILKYFYTGVEIEKMY